MNPSTKTQPVAILLIIFFTVFTSSGQILWKIGLGKSDLNTIISFLNIPLVLGFLSYGIGLVLMILAFKRGELSVLFPIIATSYVWVSLASPYFVPTDFMNHWKWAGVMVIVIAVSILGIGNSRRSEYG